MSSKKIKTAIAIIGKISSGKTSWAKYLSKELGMPIASFGSYLKKYSENLGLPTTREDLQNLGDRFIKEDPIAFLINVIDDLPGSNESIIFEGVRHLAIFEGIISLSDRVTSIFIGADEPTRYDRYQGRIKEGDTKISFEEFRVIDNHTVEQEIEQIRPKCNFVINNIGDFDALISEYLPLIRVQI